MANRSGQGGGGEGGGAEPALFTRAEMRLLERSIRQRFPMSDEARKVVTARFQEFRSEIRIGIGKQASIPANPYAGLQPDRQLLPAVQAGRLLRSIRRPTLR